MTHWVSNSNALNYVMQFALLLNSYYSNSQELDDDDDDDDVENRIKVLETTTHLPICVRAPEWRRQKFNKWTTSN